MRLADRQILLPVLRANAAPYARLYERARAQSGYAECLCRTPPPKLVIRSRAGRFHLACWPGGGAEHAVDCDFHRLDALSGRSTYTQAAILETETGTTIRLDAALTLRLAGSATIPTQSSPLPVEGIGRRTVGLLGLLHFLWEHARLNIWRTGWRRNWANCYVQLSRPIQDCLINRQDLTEALHVVPPYQPQTAFQTDAVFEAFVSRLIRQGKSGRRGLLLGELKSIAPTKYGARVMLRHLRTPVFIALPLLERIQHKYRPAFSKVRADHSRQIALLVVERTAKGNLSVVEAAVMLTNRAYVPGDSSYEVLMADHLIASGRSFLKPMHYDGGAVFPDFILTDVEPFCYVEVYGITGRESYEERKRAKQNYYRSAGMSVIEWEVAASLPPLTRTRPAARR
ncbi:DUF1173 family protein [Sphaerisporangium album]|uniref:DUF1173 family protein n=1 Tax=Sphaerisporangium album TaxID=509200 RepID=UPI001FE73D07|nr:DUF1173 family protein [Sphaerisporangium album]